MQSIAQDLPFDILHEIFELCLPSMDNPQLSRQPNSSLAPLLLCHICESWRTAAIGMSSIWKSTTFTIHTVRRPDPPSNRQVLLKTTRFISWWRKHIGDVAPSLYLPWPSPRRGNRPIRYNELNNLDNLLFKNTFFRSAHSLRLTIMNQELDVICSHRVPFPNLVELRIENIQDSRIPRMILSPFPPSPNLTRLQLSHAESFEQKALNIFPWSQLTHLYLPRTISIDVWKILAQRCINLKTAAIIMSGADSNLFGSPIVIDSLRHLVAASNSRHTAVPFTGLVFPQLTALRIVNGPTASRIDNIEELEELLSGVPALVELHFDCTLSFADENYIPFDQAHIRNGQGLSAYLPRLQYLVIDYIDPSNDNVGKNIIRFLKSNWLRSGWDSSKSLGQRKLEFIVQSSSYFDDQPIPAEIVAEVTAYLTSEWPADAPFDVSIHEEEFGALSGRGIYDVFDEKLPNIGWDEAVNFYTSH